VYDFGRREVKRKIDKSFAFFESIFIENDKSILVINIFLKYDKNK
jgi:hypothetical protein